MRYEVNRSVNDQAMVTPKKEIIGQELRKFHESAVSTVF